MEPVFKVGKDLVGGLNLDGRSSSRRLRILEEEECECLDRFPNVFLVDLNLDEIRRMEFSSWKEDFEDSLCFSFLIEEIDPIDETLGSLWEKMPLVGGYSCSNNEMDDVNGG